MTKETIHKWAFAPRFRRGSFGWKSQPAIARIKEAVVEIKKVARTDQILGAEGAVLFLEKISPALEHVDSSSGAIGSAVNNAIDTLAPIIAQAPAAESQRQRWLDRLWQAMEEDQIPYIEYLGEVWGDLCATPRIASLWADDLSGSVRTVWTGDPRQYGFFKGTSSCLSALFKAGRHDEIVELLSLAPYQMWHYRRWGVKALVAMGKKEEALQYAEGAGGVTDSPCAIAEACEEILLSEGQFEEAYRRYAFQANSKTTYLATFRAIVKKYPHKSPREILNDLVANSAGQEGKWFAAARSAGLLSEALELANRSPCDPKTLTRAAQDMVKTEPHFAMEAGMAALKWLAQGYGYEVTGADVWSAYQCVMDAAEAVGRKEEIEARIRKLMAEDASSDRNVSSILARAFDLGKRDPW